MTPHTWVDLFWLVVAFTVADAIWYICRTIYERWYWRRQMVPSVIQVPSVSPPYDYTWILAIFAWFIFLVIVRRLDRAS